VGIRYLPPISTDDIFKPVNILPQEGTVPVWCN
jgi:hypothetical protein